MGSHGNAAVVVRSSEIEAHTSMCHHLRIVWSEPAVHTGIMVVPFLVPAVWPCFAILRYDVAIRVHSLLRVGLSMVFYMGFAMICILLSGTPQPHMRCCSRTVLSLWGRRCTEPCAVGNCRTLCDHGDIAFEFVSIKGQRDPEVCHRPGSLKGTFRSWKCDKPPWRGSNNIFA